MDWFGVVCLAFSLCLAFLLGAWVRAPFPLWLARSERTENFEKTESLEDRRQRQMDAILRYSMADAKKAAEGGEGI